MPSQAISIDVLDQLIKSRAHGAINIGGVRFQLLYSLLRSFDLYSALSTMSIKFEGLEDLDKKGFRSGSILYQVKSSKSAQGWGWFNQEKILDHFIDVYRLDSSTNFVIVTNFRLNGDLEKLRKLCQSRSKNIPDSLRTKLQTIADRNKIELSKTLALLHRISFEYTNEQQINEQLKKALVEHFEIETGNEILYFSRLFHCVVDWAAQRKEICKQNLDAEKLFVSDQIGRGIEDPALRNRLIEPVTLQSASSTEDYYDGKRAQLRHIVANLDAPRPNWQQTIHNTLQEVTVCIIKASSGQGKSTLVYRYAYNNFLPNAIYQLNTCSEEEHVGQTVNYLRNRLTLGLPLLVLIDNLDFSRRLWYRVAASLSGENIRFLVATRVEDWYRYGANQSSYTYKFIEPRLDLMEARLIFQYFSEKGKLANNVRSADWAFEKIADKGLLIEFVYLVTHGHMLAERIEEQLGTIEEKREDPAKLDILRLVSVAQLYGAKVGIDAILQLVQFSGDSERTLRSLIGEYIDVNGDDCEGLHLVRSEHLVRFLHNLLPLEHTLKRLVQSLDQINLAALVSNMFADTSLKHEPLLGALCERGKNDSLTFVNAILEALHLATESLFIQKNKPAFDALVAISGPSSLLLATGSTTPSGEFNLFEQLSGLDTFASNPGFQLQRMIVEQIHSREELGTQQTAKEYLQFIVDHVSFDGTIPLDELAHFGNWCSFFHVEAPRLRAYYANTMWEDQFWQSHAEQKSTFLFSLHLIAPERYTNFSAEHLAQLLGEFKESFDTLTIQEKENRGIRIEFIVNEEDSNSNPHEQVLWRLQHLRCWFPNFDLYCAQGLYPSMGDQPLEVDDTHKEMAGETLDKGIYGNQNARYIRRVDEIYAPKSFYEWIEQWLKLRRQVLSMANELMTLHDAIYANKSYDTNRLEKIFVTLGELHRQIPSLPIFIEQTLGEKSKKIQSTFRKWESSISAFERQYLQFLCGEDKQHSAHLMRCNLRDAMEILPQFQADFATTLQTGQGTFTPFTLDQQEQTTYIKLVDMFDFEYGEDKRHIRQFLNARTLTKAIQMWKHLQEESFVAKIQQCLAPLEKVGLKFIYPAGRYRKGLLIDLYLAYEVIDFENIADQVGCIAYLLANLELNYSFLYLIATINGHIIGGATMVGRDTLKELLAGKQSRNQFHLASIPQNVQELLPGINPTAFEDIDFVQRIKVVVARYIVERNKLYFVRSKLVDKNVNNTVRLHDATQNFIKKSDELSISGHEICTEARLYTNLSIVSTEWNELWDQIEHLLNALATPTTVDGEYIACSIFQPLPLDLYYFRYLNRKYCVK